MDNDDTDNSKPTPGPMKSGGGSSNRGAIAVAVVMFLIGGVIGLLGGLLLGEDDDGDGGDAAPASEVVIDCSEAEALVERSSASMETINESEVQNASFFAALLVEQRTVVFAMEAAPSCFSLEDRGGAQGLLDGLVVLAQASGPLPAQEVATPDEGE